MKTQTQLEFGIDGVNRCPRIARHKEQANRANWWFGQMRQVVERALDWEPAPRFRPEQIMLSESRER